MEQTAHADHLKPRGFCFVPSSSSVGLCLPSLHNGRLCVQCPAPTPAEPRLACYILDTRLLLHEWKKNKLTRAKGKTRFFFFGETKENEIKTPERNTQVAGAIDGREESKAVFLCWSVTPQRHYAFASSTRLLRIPHPTCSVLRFALLVHPTSYLWRFSSKEPLDVDTEHALDGKRRRAMQMETSRAGDSEAACVLHWCSPLYVDAAKTRLAQHCDDACALHACLFAVIRTLFVFSSFQVLPFTLILCWPCFFYAHFTPAVQNTRSNRAGNESYSLELSREES